MRKGSVTLRRITRTRTSYYTIGSRTNSLAVMEGTYLSYSWVVTYTDDKWTSSVGTKAARSYDEYSHSAVVSVSYLDVSRRMDTYSTS